MMERIKKKKRTFFLCIFSLGVLLGILWHRAWLFPFPQLSEVKHRLRAVRSPAQITHVERKPTRGQLRIPVEYLPKFRIEKDEVGEKKVVCDLGKTILNVPASEAALVLVDTWEEPHEAGQPEGIRYSQKLILQRCRDHNIVVIHTPGSTVAEKYPQYLRLREELHSFVIESGRQSTPVPPFLTWPPSRNPVWKVANEIRAEGRAGGLAMENKVGRDISRHLQPLEDEYVVSSHEEFRYVLWKERITVLLYMGSALNECMLQRPTGINSLAGTDTRRAAFTIIVLGDCSSAVGGPSFDAETAAAAMLDYYKWKLAFVANSRDIVFSED